MITQEHIIVASIIMGGVGNIVIYLKQQKKNKKLKDLIQNNRNELELRYEKNFLKIEGEKYDTHQKINRLNLKIKKQIDEMDEKMKKY